MTHTSTETLICLQVQVVRFRKIRKEKKVALFVNQTVLQKPLHPLQWGGVKKKKDDLDGGVLNILNIALIWLASQVLGINENFVFEFLFR